ncbi:hypothetical protein BDN72DRAFT_801506 [Pluteus cervinus]|uniref:Uncharacterized protein n=1 Tax=Pluteus cervinus TaxID=181527 RepID=A0ACD3AHB9_9AGAR|nr:hypothetical protein BDN72DRAFT_801506 [Pluteus cervinus]
MEPAARTGSLPPDIPQVGLGEGVQVMVEPSSDQGYASQTPTQPQNTSITHEIAQPDAIDASQEHGQTSNLAAMDVDLPNTVQTSEEDAIQRGSVSGGTGHGSQELVKNDLFKNGDDTGDDDGAESDEDIDEEDDEDSELSEGEDLRDDMDFALSGLDFKGTYAIAHTFPHGPNPWLTIEGLGLIGLPLSQIDAGRIKSSSRQAPYGHGNTTVVNTDVRNTWEIASQLVSFGNLEWHTFLKENVLAAVRDGLGLTADLNTLRPQLHKLLLYETGSHFLPHQDTPKLEGMFATIIVLLPSYYTGGEVHVSHSTDSKALSLPPNSFFQTSVLAWYADVTHSVKPVESGYRLALLYNLIHTAQNQPTLNLPVTSTKIARLRRTLEKWLKGKYNEEDDPHCDLLAFLLDHQYSPVELGRGSNALKGKDAHIMANLRPIAAEMDLVLLLGSLKYTVTGQSSENRYGTGYRGYTDPDGDGEKEIAVSDIVSLSGDLVIGKKKYTSLEEYQIVPKDAFDDNPDGEEAGGYMGNEESTVDYWYNRTILILLHKSREQDFFLSTGGLEYAVSELKKANPLAPTKADLQLLNKATARLTVGSRTECDQLMNITLSWKRFDLWKPLCDKRIASYPGGDKIPYTEALGTFGFKKIQPIFEQVLASTGQLSERFDFIRLISTHASKDDSIPAWCTTQRFTALETIHHLRTDDVALIMEVARTEGVSRTMISVLPSLNKSNMTPDVWVALLKTIRQSMEDESTTGQAEDCKEFIPQCLDGAISCWVKYNSASEVIPPRMGYFSSINEDHRVRSSLELISLVISFGYLDLTSKILDVLLFTKGIVPDRFKYLYSPFIPPLRQLLAKHNLSIITPPFSNFAQNIIGLYLRDLLGGKGEIIQTMVRKLGCSAGCDDCRALDALMMSPDREYHLRAAQKRRKHIQDQIGYGSGKDLVSFHTITTGTPHLLVVTKNPEVISASQWPTRQASAQAFLKLFGEGDVITQVMGNRAADVEGAVSGRQAFRWAGLLSTSVSTGGASTMPVATTTGSTSTAASGLASRPHQTAQPSSSSSLPGVSRPPASTKVAGKKRKRTAVISQGPIIDLTLEDE